MKKSIRQFLFGLTMSLAGTLLPLAAEVMPAAAMSIEEITVEESSMEKIRSTKKRTLNSSEISAAVEQKVAQLVSECVSAGAETDYQKAQWFHDWLINHADYDESLTIFGPEGVLLQGSGVCQSYTDAYGLLLNAVEIENMEVISDEMDHTWNIVKINGSWTHIDVTWDDPTGGGYEGRNYFGLGDQKMSVDHVWPAGVYPECYDIVHDDEIRLPSPNPLMSVPLEGIDYHFMTAAGQLLTRKDFTQENTLLIYGRPACMNTMGFVNGITYLKDMLKENGVNVIVVFENKEQVAQYASQLPFLCVYEADNAQDRWELMRKAGLLSDYGYVLPLLVLQDEDGYVHYSSTGHISDPDKIAATVMQKLPETGKTISSVPFYLYTNEAELKNILAGAMKNRQTMIRVNNLFNGEFKQQDLNLALDYAEQNASAYGAFLKAYLTYGSVMTFEFEYINKPPQTTDKVPETEKTPETGNTQGTTSQPDKNQGTDKNSSIAAPNKTTVKIKKGKSTTSLVIKNLAVDETVVSWKTGNKKVFTVKGNPDGTCKITAKKKTGSAKLTVKLSSGKELSIKVKVEAVKTPTAIKNVPKKKTLKKGKSFTINPKLSPSGAEGKITFSSSKPKVASVTSKGKVKAKKKGTTTITVKVGKLKKTCKITVK